MIKREYCLCRWKGRNVRDRNELMRCRKVNLKQTQNTGWIREKRAWGGLSSWQVCYPHLMGFTMSLLKATKDKLFGGSYKGIPSDCPASLWSAVKASCSTLLKFLSSFLRARWVHWWGKRQERIACCRLLIGLAARPRGESKEEWDPTKHDPQKKKKTWKTVHKAAIYSVWGQGNNLFTWLY